MRYENKEGRNTNKAVCMVAERRKNVSRIFCGKKECSNFEELREVLDKRTEKGVNEFIISTNEPFPYMIMSVKERVASLSYFREEDDPGYSSINSVPILEADDISITF